MKRCRECQFLRHELAQIDVYVQRYERDVQNGLPPQEVRRRAVLGMGLICDRLSTLKNTHGVPNDRDRELFPPNTSHAKLYGSPAPEARSSLRTMFEFRGRSWLLFPISWALLLMAAAVTWWLMKG